ncbi:MAG: hypothetical protein FWD47_04380 [Treponema sp.]|nr:hypothetical protein [Treponema sp.]
MKKILFTVLITTLLTAAAFAQNLTFGGYFNSGLGLITQGDNDAEIKAFGVDSESNGYRFRLNANYQNNDRTSGFRLRLQSQRTLADTGGYLSIPFAYGWMNFFDNMISVSGGIVDDSAWQTADWWINDDVGEGLGLLLKIAPIEGLNLGAGAYVNSQRGGGNNNVLALPVGSNGIKLGEVKYVISGSYLMKDVFYIGASARTENRTGNQQSGAIIGDLRLLMIKDLTAVFAFQLDNLQDFDNTGTMTFSETFAFKLTDDINVGLNAAQFFFNVDNRDPAFLFNLWGSYTMGSLVPRIDLVYFINGESNGANSANSSTQFHRKGYAARQDRSVFSVRPSLRFNLDSRTHIEIGDVLYLDSAKNEVTNWGNEKSLFTNVFYIDVRWSF